MAQTKPIPVRLESSIIARLDAASKRMGTNRSALMKFLLQTFIESFERRGLGSLPHDWQDIMHGLDGRTFGQLGLHAAETPDAPKISTAARKPVRYSAKSPTKPKKPKP